MKKYLKSILCLILALSLVFAVAACGEDDSADDDDEDEEEAKEKDKDEKETDEDEEDNKDSKKKENLKNDDDEDDDTAERELIGKTKDEKAAEEAFYEFVEEYNKERIKALKEDVAEFDLPEDCEDRFLEHAAKLYELMYSDYQVTDIDEEDDDVMKIDFELSSYYMDDDWSEAMSAVYPLFEEADDKDFEDDFNDLMDELDKYLKNPNKYATAETQEGSVFVVKDGKNWEVDLEYGTEDGDWCDLCDCYTEELYYYDGWDLCWDCYCDEAYVEEATEAVSSVSGWCDWCDSYDYDLYYWDGDYICEDCWYSF